MVTLHRVSRWKIAVYGREHGEPHFHIEGPGWRCSVSIATLTIIVGEAPPREFSAAIAWAQDRQSELLAKWRELNP